MKYELKRSNRKTVSITVRNAQVKVRAPFLFPKKSIDDFVNSKQDLIRRHISTQIEHREKQEGFTVSYGDDILYMGSFVKVESIVPPGLNTGQLKQAIRTFYIREAKHRIGDMVERYSKLMDAFPAGVRITAARTRWGSCSSKGNVNFSWYLIMASREQIEYVVVHELAHIKEMNHSQRFWNIVERYIPDYKEKRKELKSLNKRLLTENWY